jgi:uncharacterized protein HemX
MVWRMMGNSSVKKEEIPMRKRRALWIALCAAAGIALAGCGLTGAGSDEAKKEGKNTGQSAGQKAESESAISQELRRQMQIYKELKQYEFEQQKKLEEDLKKKQKEAEKKEKEGGGNKKSKQENEGGQ